MAIIIVRATTGAGGGVVVKPNAARPARLSTADSASGEETTPPALLGKGPKKAAPYPKDSGCIADRRTDSRDYAIVPDVETTFLKLLPQDKKKRTISRRQPFTGRRNVFYLATGRGSHDVHWACVFIASQPYGRGQPQADTRSASASDRDNVPAESAFYVAIGGSDSWSTRRWNIGLDPNNYTAAAM